MNTVTNDAQVGNYAWYVRLLLYCLNPLAIHSRQINVNFSIQIVGYIEELWTIHLSKRFACGRNDSLEIHNSSFAICRSPFEIRHYCAISIKIVLLKGILRTVFENTLKNGTTTQFRIIIDVESMLESNRNS